MYFLAIETTCDETAAAVFNEDAEVLSSIVASQADLHARFGGVVPEIASRAHVRQILPIIDESLHEAGVRLDQIGAIAVAYMPGLIGAILVGLTAAKTLAMTLNVPLLGVNHLEGHIYACQMAHEHDVFPCIGLVISGGHSNLFHCRSATEFDLIGATTDDAAGEAFDKVASILGLGYPGGPNVERAARSGNNKAYRFPRPFLHDDRLEFSFSGLKTAVLYTVHGPNATNSDRVLTQKEIADLAASFQQAVIDVLVAKARQAVNQLGLQTFMCWRRRRCERSASRRFGNNVRTRRRHVGHSTVSLVHRQRRHGRRCSRKIQALPVRSSRSRRRRRPCPHAEVSASRLNRPRRFARVAPTLSTAR